jgi:hypothetical protein
MNEHVVLLADNRAAVRTALPRYELAQAAGVAGRIDAVQLFPEQIFVKPIIRL